MSCVHGGTFSQQRFGGTTMTLKIKAFYWVNGDGVSLQEIIFPFLWHQHKEWQFLFQVQAPSATFIFSILLLVLLELLEKKFETPYWACLWQCTLIFPKISLASTLYDGSLKVENPI